MAKTRDGLRIDKILRATREKGIGEKQRTNHYQLTYKGYRPCPLATSTHARRNLAPWLADITGESKDYCYDSIRRGSW